jgi:hypothetical protein
VNDPIFTAAMSNVEALLRAAVRAGETGDAGAVGAELVRAALNIGVQIGSLKTRYAANYPSTPQAKQIEKALRMLQTTAVRAYARVEELRGAETEDEILDEPAQPTAEFETPYSEEEESEYIP